MRQKSMGEEVANQSKSKATSKKISSLPELINSSKKPSAPASPGQVRKANNSSNSKQQKSPKTSPTPIIKNGSTSNSTTYKQLTQKKGGSASQRSKSSTSSSSVFQKHHSSNSSSSSSKQQYHANHGHHSHHQASHQQAHHMKSSMSNKGSDVELIVRKKLITTTTTTTMTPIHTPPNVSAANSTSADVGASSNQLNNKSQVTKTLLPNPLTHLSYYDSCYSKALPLSKCYNSYYLFHIIMIGFNRLLSKFWKFTNSY